VKLQLARWRRIWQKSRGSLRTQLVVWNIVTLAVMLGLLGLGIRQAVRLFLMAPVYHVLESQVPRSFPRQRPVSALRDATAKPAGSFAPRSEILSPRHFDLQGKPFGARLPLDPGALAIAQTGYEYYSKVTIVDEPVLVLTVPIRWRGEIVGTGQTAYPIAEVERAIEGLNAALLMYLPVALLVAGAGGVLLTDRVLQRVRLTASAAERLSGEGVTDFSARLPVSGNDEFAQLAGTFNRLLHRMEASYRQQNRLLEQQRRFTADASHEMKTPLTVIKGRASMGLSDPCLPPLHRQSLAAIDLAADTMTDLVQDLLLLARADAGQLGASRTQLLVEELLRRAVSGIPADGRAILLDVRDETLTVVGQEKELLRVFCNLLENAVRYTPPPGTIQIIAHPDGRMTRVTVRDTGIGIAPEHLPHLGERFFRVDTARARTDGGTGLGLSICKSIIDAHGGTLEFESEPGKGTCVTVRLPA
jgi:signal transduction histidine kinase